MSKDFSYVQVTVKCHQRSRGTNVTLQDLHDSQNKTFNPCMYHTPKFLGLFV